MKITMTFKTEQVIEANGDTLKCIVSDSNYAVFARLSKRYDKDGKSFMNTDFEKLCVYDNTGTVGFEYELISNVEKHFA